MDVLSLNLFKVIFFGLLVLFSVLFIGYMVCVFEQHCLGYMVISLTRMLLSVMLEYDQAECLVLFVSSPRMRVHLHLRIMLPVGVQGEVLS